MKKILQMVISVLLVLGLVFTCSCGLMGGEEEEAEEKAGEVVDKGEEEAEEKAGEVVDKGEEEAEEKAGEVVDKDEEEAEAKGAVEKARELAQKAEEMAAEDAAKMVEELDLETAAKMVEVMNPEAVAPMFVLMNPEVVVEIMELVNPEAAAEIKELMEALTPVPARERLMAEGATVIDNEVASRLHEGSTYRLNNHVIIKEGTDICLRKVTLALENTETVLYVDKGASLKLEECKLTRPWPHGNVILVILADSAKLAMVGSMVVGTREGRSPWPQDLEVSGESPHNASFQFENSFAGALDVLDLGNFLLSSPTRPLGGYAMGGIVGCNIEEVVITDWDGGRHWKHVTLQQIDEVRMTNCSLKVSHAIIECQELTMNNSKFKHERNRGEHYTAVSGTAHLLHSELESYGDMVMGKLIAQDSRIGGYKVRMKVAGELRLDNCELLGVTINAESVVMRGCDIFSAVPSIESAQHIQLENCTWRQTAECKLKAPVCDIVANQFKADMFIIINGKATLIDSKVRVKLEQNSALWCSVDIAVKSPSGEGIPGISVSIVGTFTGKEVASGTTDVDGFARLIVPVKRRGMNGEEFQGNYVLKLNKGGTIKELPLTVEETQLVEVTW